MKVINKLKFNYMKNIAILIEAIM